MFGFQGDFRAMKPNVLILDLSDAPYVDSAGLGLIVNQHVSSSSVGKSFLIAGANFRVDALMEVTKVKQILKTFPTVEAAEASL
jgi:anti-sigma B factor antagonist